MGLGLPGSRYRKAMIFVTALGAVMMLVLAQLGTPTLVPYPYHVPVETGDQIKTLPTGNTGRELQEMESKEAFKRANSKESQSLIDDEKAETHSWGNPGGGSEKPTRKNAEDGPRDTLDISDVSESEDPTNIEAGGRPEGPTAHDDTGSKPFSLSVTNDMLYARKVKLPALLDRFRNPCWLEELPQPFSYNSSPFGKLCHNPPSPATTFYQDKATRVRCYPYFYLIGVQKCGTSDLYHAMQEYHPHIAPPLIKESQFWSRRIHGICGQAITKRELEHEMELKGVGVPATLADYLDLNDGFGLSYYNNTDAYNPGVLGDYTPAHSFSLPQWRSIPGNEGLQEPRITLAHILYSIRPQTRIIVSLRNPVERLRSNFEHQNRAIKARGFSIPENFHKFLEEHLANFNACMTNSTLKGCVFDLCSPLVRGMYHVLLQDWLDVFPSNQLHVIRFEDYKEDRTVVLDNIVKFLDLDPSLAVMDGVLPKKRKKRRMEMFPADREMLEKFYQPYNQALEKQLGRSMDWNY